MPDVSREIDPPDEISDVTAGEIIREVVMFAAVIGALAGGCYGLVIGYQDFRHIPPGEVQKSAWVIALWGAIWAAGGAVTLSIALGLIVSLGTGAVNLLRKIARR